MKAGEQVEFRGDEVMYEVEDANKSTLGDYTSAKFFYAGQEINPKDIDLVFFNTEYNEEEDYDEEYEEEEEDD